MKGKYYFYIAAAFSFTISFLHVAIIWGGGDWYRVFGAGEELAIMAESGSLYPLFMTAVIAVIFSVWAFYALSGAGYINKLPLLKAVLCAITAIFIGRGLIGFIAPFISTHPFVLGNSTTFWMYSSALCLIIGIVYLLGVVKNWQVMSELR